MSTPTNVRKSTYSQGTSNCAEVGETAAAIVVLDSKQAGGHRDRLTFSMTAWRAYIARTKEE